jgi:hypothetical protein
MMCYRLFFHVEKLLRQTHSLQRFGGFSGYDSYCNPITAVLPAGGRAHV